MVKQTDYARGLLTSEPTNWVDPLKAVYARQTAQLEEHHTNLRARDKAKVERATAESIPALLVDLANFSTSIAKLKEANEINKVKKDKEEKTKFELWLKERGITSEDLDAWSKAKKEYYNDKKNDQLKFDKEIDYIAATLGEDRKHLANDIKKLSGKQAIFFEEVLGLSTVRHSGQGVYEDWLSEKGTPGEYAAYEKLSPEAKTAAHQKWLLEDRLNHLNLTDEFKVAILGDEVKRNTSTTKNVALNQAFVKAQTDEDEGFNTAISGLSNHKEALNTFIFDKHDQYRTYFKENPNLIPEGHTATTWATKKIHTHLRRGLHDGAIQLHQIEDYLKSPTDHAAGDTIEKAFFSGPNAEGLIADLVAAGKDYQNGVIARKKLELKQGIDDLKRRLLVPDSGITTEQKNLEIQRLKSLGASSEQINELENINEFAQTRENYELTMKEYISNPLKIINGTDAEFNSIPNVQARIAIQEMKRQLVESETLHGTSKKSIYETVLKSADAPWPIGVDVKGTGVPGEIALEIDNKGEVYRAQLVWSIYNRDGNLNSLDAQQINTQVSQYKQDLWKAGGGDDPGGDGIYSFDANTGTYKNYINRSRDLIDIKSDVNYSTTNLVNWEQTGVDLRLKYPTNEDLLASKVAILSKEEFQHVVLFGDASDKTEYILSLYPGMTLKEVMDQSQKIYTETTESDKTGKNLPWFRTLNYDRYLNAQDAQLDAKNFMIQGLDQVISMQNALNDFEAGSARALLTELEIKPWHLIDDGKKKRIMEILQNSFELDGAFDKSISQLTDRSTEAQEKISGETFDYEVDPNPNATKRFQIMEEIAKRSGVENLDIDHFIETGEVRELVVNEETPKELTFPSNQFDIILENTGE